MSESGPPAVPSSQDRNDHWKFLRDVAVFQLKMLLDNVRDFALMPISLVAAAIDRIFKGDRQGSLFYQVLRWGAHSEEVIDVYSAIAPQGRPEVNPSYTVDAVIARLEGVLVRECEKGGRLPASKQRWIRQSAKFRSRQAARATAQKRRLPVRLISYAAS